MGQSKTTTHSKVGYLYLLSWPVPNKQLASLPVARPLGNTSLPREPRSPPPPVESRSPTDIDPVPLLSVKSASSPSNVLCVRLLRITSPIFVSNLPRWLLFRRPPSLTWLVSSRIPTCAPSTPSVSPS